MLQPDTYEKKTLEPERLDVTGVSNYWSVRSVCNMSQYKINLSDRTHLS